MVDGELVACGRNAQVVAGAFAVVLGFGVALGFASVLGFAELPESLDFSAAGLLAELLESAEPEPEPEPESDPELEPEPESDEDEDEDAAPDPPASAPTRSERAFESLRLSVR